MEKYIPYWSKKLRRERERHGWSQNQVAEKIGVDTKTVGRWESGIIRTLPRLDARARLCELYEKTDVELGFVIKEEDTRNELKFLDRSEYAEDRSAARAVSVHEALQHIDWGEAPSVGLLLGRDGELALLEQWIIENECRVIAILGTGGIGKTSIAVTITDHMQDRFDYVFWRSLQNAPPIENILQKCILMFSDNLQVDLPGDIEEQITLLITYLRKYRCLLVLDNLETVLQGGDEVGYWREGYEGYGRLIKRLGEVHHQSCVVLTSREKPKEVAHVERSLSTVYSLQLKGLGLNEGMKILQNTGLFGSDDAWRALIYLYSGNPLALQLVSGTIREVFLGDITKFLKEGMAVFGDVHDLLDQQFHRLSVPEKEILYWLAIEREMISLNSLSENIVRQVSKATLLKTIASLQRRYMLEISNSAYFTLQPVIMQYVTDDLIEKICNEIQTLKPKLLTSHALIKAQAKDYVRESQVRLILKVILLRLLDDMGKEEFEEQCKAMLTLLREVLPRKASYAAGNILNLLIQMQTNLHDFDFSHLQIRQASLQGKHLFNVNFAHAHFMASVFTDIFAGILSVDLNSQDKLIAVGTATGEIRMWYIPNGIPYQTYQAHESWIWSIAFNPDGNLLASGSEDQTIRLWDVTSGQCLRILVDANSIYSVAFSPDGNLLASGSEDQTIRLWDVTSGQCLCTLLGHTNLVRSVAFSPDGNLLASGSEDQTIRLWDVTSGQCLRTLLGHTHWVRAVGFSFDGNILASGGEDQTIRLWDVASGQSLVTFQGYTNPIWSIAFSPDGSTIASGNSDQQVSLWNVTTGQCFHVFHGHTQRIESVVFSPDGTLIASGSGDQSIRLWNVNTKQYLKTFQGHANPVWTIDFNPRGNTLASGGDDGTIRVWDINTGQCLHLLPGHLKEVRSIAFNPTGTLLASGSEDQTIRLWEVNTDRCIRILQGHTNRVWSIAFSPDGNILASGSEDHTVRLWQVNSGQCLDVLRGYAHQVRFVVFSPDGYLLATCGGDKLVHVWEVSSGRCLRSLVGHEGWVWSLAFSPDGGVLASGSEDGTIKIWSIDTGTCIKTMRSLRPYENVNITGVEGLTESQKVTLRALGAEDNEQ